MCEIKDDLIKLAKEHRNTLKILNELGIESILNIEKNGNAAFKRIEDKGFKMFTMIRGFIILSILIFGAPIGYLFIENTKKADAKSVMYKYEEFYLHNAESEYYKGIIDKAANGKIISNEKFKYDISNIRKDWLNITKRDNNDKK